MIKAVIFDYGGVISSGGVGQGLSASFSKKVGISHEQANSILHTPWHKLVRGEISDNQFWQETEHNYGKPIPLENRNVFVTWAELQPRPEILSFISELKSKGCIVGLLSNVIASVSEDIRIHRGYDLFDPCLLSYEIGYAKPEIEIFKRLLELLPNIKPEEIVYIDDLEKSMPPARELGIKSIVATSSTDIIENVRKLFD